MSYFLSRHSVDDTCLTTQTHILHSNMTFLCSVRLNPHECMNSPRSFNYMLLLEQFSGKIGTGGVLSMVSSTST